MDEESWWQKLAEILGMSDRDLRKHPLPIGYYYRDGHSPEDTARAIMNTDW